MKSVMSHSFSQVPRADIPRSSFNRSHGVKTTFDAGFLVPILRDEVLPGDTFNVNTFGFARLSTPLYPIMDNLFLETFYFFVPLRLIWDNFQKMMGEQKNPGDSVDYTVPIVTGPGMEGTLFDHMGIPNVAANIDFSALPFRAYMLIWNEWFRDQNLQNSVDVPKDDGPDIWASYSGLKRRGKRHDYFTSCLPWPQKGEAVAIPLGSDVPVLGIGKANNTYDYSSQVVYETGGTSQTTYASAARFDGDVIQNRLYVEEDPDNGGYPRIYADLSNATAATINQLREAFQVQKMYERDARGGTRYTEIVRSHFGVTSPDMRLQRPEYLGGGSSRINVSAVAQTSETGTTPQGTLAAIGTATVNGHGFTKSFTEHGIILGLANVRADLTYQQGLPREFSRQDRLDFYWPALAQIGEQAVLNIEIYAQGNAQDDDVFGYQERFAEYRYKPSEIHGAFRSTHSASLDAWHLSQEFGALPTLSNTFIQDNPPLDRVVATPSEPHIIADFYHQMICARPMPLFGVPGMIDHF